MPATKRDMDTIAALFIDDPRAMLSFLYDISINLSESEPEFSKVWKLMATKIEEAQHASKPLYKK